MIFSPWANIILVWTTIKSCFSRKLLDSPQAGPILLPLATTEFYFSFFHAICHTRSNCLSVGLSHQPGSNSGWGLLSQMCTWAQHRPWPRDGLGEGPIPMPYLWDHHTQERLRLMSVCDHGDGGVSVLSGKHPTQMQGMGLVSSLGFILPPWSHWTTSLGGEDSRIVLRNHGIVGMNPQQNITWN